VHRREDGAANAWDSEYVRGRYRDEPPVEFVKDIIRVFRGCAPDLRQGLYIGCGNGRNFIPLCEAGLSLVGVDISDEAIAQLRTRLPEAAANLHVATVEDLPVGAAFPFVIGIQVFQHGTRKAAHKHLRAAQRRVDPGGYFCLRVNAVGTDIWPSHDVRERFGDGSLTVRYSEGPKAGLDVHFFAEEELASLFETDFVPVVPLRGRAHSRYPTEQGAWLQWEAIWRRKN